MGCLGNEIHLPALALPQPISCASKRTVWAHTGSRLRNRVFTGGSYDRHETKSRLKDGKGYGLRGAAAFVQHVHAFGTFPEWPCWLHF